MASPQQLAHGATHGIADRDDGAGFELQQELRTVVGAVGEPKYTAGANAAGVASQIGRDHPEML